MSIHAIYRLGVWLPLAVPAVVALLVHGAGLVVDAGPLKALVQVLLASLLYGGIPYAGLALWATWWIGRRDEAEIKWVMFRAPLLMIAVFVAFWALVAIFNRGDMPLSVFAAVSVLGPIVIMPVGYAYVFLVLLIREEWGPAPSATTTG